MSRIYFDLISQKYNEEEYSLAAEFWRNYDLELITKYLPRKRNVYIDLGCGNGLYSSTLAKYFKRSILIDFSLSMVSKSKQLINSKSPNLHVDYICMDFRELDCLSLSSVSFFLANGAALCYQRDTLFRMISHVHSMLESGGIFYFEVWSKYGILQSSKLESSPYCMLQEHLKGLDIKEILKYLKNGETLETAWGHSTKIKTFTLKEVKKILDQFDFQSVFYFGRKAIYLIMSLNDINRLIVSNPKELLELEKLLRKAPEVIQICPKIIFIVEKS